MAWHDGWMVGLAIMVTLHYNKGWWVLKPFEGPEKMYKTNQLLKYAPKTVLNSNVIMFVFNNNVSKEN